MTGGEWIELHRKSTGIPFLRKVSGIRHVLKLDEHCSVDGEDVIESYDEVKRLIRSDARRFVLDHEIDFRIRELKMITVHQTAAKLPGEKAKEFVLRLMCCCDMTEVHNLIEEYSCF